ncbi:MAG: hypothetical protein SNJ84_07160 [Verrucomicrobiia bacterium]
MAAPPAAGGLKPVPVGQQAPGVAPAAPAAAAPKSVTLTKPVPTVAPINVVGDPVANYLAVGAAVASLAVLGVVLSSYLGFL